MQKNSPCEMKAGAAGRTNGSALTGLELSHESKRLGCTFAARASVPVCLMRVQLGYAVGMPTPTAVAIELSEDERVRLESWSRRRKTAQALALRSRIVLCAADGLSNSQIAEQIGVSRQTVTKWRGRFAESRLEGLLDEPRPGRPRTVSDDQVERIVITTLESTPKDATHWSTRSLAAHLGVSQNAVWRTWQAFSLQPHRQEKFKLSTDPQFVEKVYDICGLYLNPPERAVVLCVDEKSQIQALDRTRPILPMLPGTPQRATHDYRRNGTSSLYAALDLATGKVIGSLHNRHRAIEFHNSCRRSTSRSPSTWTSTSCSTTARPTRPRRSAAGSRPTRASICTSRRPRARG
jgi:transposase